MSQELKAENEQLRASNRKLAEMLKNMGDKLDEGRRELLATGWEAGFLRGQELAAWAIGNRPDSERPDTDNPYRKPVIDLSGAIICTTKGDA
ncbi:hypothetical protein [Paenarthrobacter sp. JL.01a]|uniref:hypothetical protein n=1 Tax=Paenarthrobacter sp. JL.01a TaxID=2979324 RepID=UPI0021C5A6CB|nr:hypothetical protein [Paenarthrobacter sp. JL.01a]UXM90928.1 hypothetical protein N5P29_16755 [Paenarthrobacter sp. JL.01a]